jgi:ATP-dependent exoDNAse (exonuclease V) alpha subunit
MLFFGDVHQLPPVVDKDELERMRKDTNNFTLTYDSFYFFNSMYFKRDFRDGEIDCYNLTASYRQLPEEKQFLELLDKIARCQITQDDLDILNTRVVDASFIEKPEMTYLTTTASAAKSKNIDYLKNNVKSYKSVSPVIKDYEVSDEDKQLAISAKRKHALNRTTADIGIGVPIIFTINGDHWKNGTQGVITAVKDDIITVKRKDGYTISVNKMTADIEIKVYNLTTKTDEEKAVAEVIGYPFCTGYAFTIHKMQGATCEGEVIVDTGSGGCFAFGQLYVSLSRVRRLQDLHLINPIKMTDIIPNEAVKRYWTKFLETATSV